MEPQGEQPAPQLTLNPFASEWRGVPEEHRCLYITFSSGFPIAENQIHAFFTRRFGDCLERVYNHQPKDGPPLFGKVVFNRSIYPSLVLNGRDEIRFVIEGRTMLCKKYYRPSTTTTEAAGDN